MMMAPSTRDDGALDEWASLREQLDGWPFTENFAVTVGDKNGPRFQYTKGNFTLRTKVLTASTSKWPMAMMFLGLIADGSIRSLDDKANQYVPWWTKDAADLKSTVTVRHLLSFTSGFGGGKPGEENVTATCMDNITLPHGDDFEACAQDLYANTSLVGTPGEAFGYNSIHLQLMGSVAMHATGLDSIQLVLRRYLYQPYAFNDSSCELPSAANPQLAVCLNTSALDYEQFLLRTLSYSALPQPLVEESERSYTPFLAKLPTLYGLYGFGHWIECFDSVEGFTQECEAAQIHCDPGAFGFYPLIDRAKGCECTQGPARDALVTRASIPHGASPSSRELTRASRSSAELPSLTKKSFHPSNLLRAAHPIPTFRRLHADRRERERRLLSAQRYPRVPSLSCEASRGCCHGGRAPHTSHLCPPHAAIQRPLPGRRQLHRAVYPEAGAVHVKTKELGWECDVGKGRWGAHRTALAATAHSDRRHGDAHFVTRVKDINCNRNTILLQKSRNDW